MDQSEGKKSEWNRQLVMACTVRDLKAATHAINNGANVNCRRPDFMTPLHIAAEHGDVEIMQLLCRAPRIKTEAKTMHGLTPLHTAALLGDTNVIQELLLKGAVINCQDNLGRYPLHYAALQNNYKVADYLIQSGSGIHVYDSFEESPLYISVLKKKNRRMTKLFAVYKLRRSPFTTRDSQPLLLEAVLSARNKNDIEIIKIIIRHGGDIINMPDSIAGRTPLHVAALTGYSELAEYLIEIGADVNAKNRAGETPAQVAMNYRNFHIIRLIEEKSNEMGISELSLAEGQHQ